MITKSELLVGRVALVTGASRGIGAGIARALGRHGAAVAVGYQRDSEAAAAVVADIQSTGSRAVAVAGDVTNADDVAAVVRAATEALGDIDILVCSAAGRTEKVIERYLAGKTLALDSVEAIQHRAAAHLAAALYPVREVVPGMRRKGGGSIVFIGAAGSRGRPAKGIAEMSVAKAAQDALARALANELGPDQIRVNTLAAGMVPTDANSGPHQPGMIEKFGGETPLGRVAQVTDVADAVVALTSDLTRHVTGVYVGVDGGRSMA